MRIFMKYFVMCMGLLASFMSTAGITTQVFVSFSMPEQLLIETLRESTSLSVPVILNGLYQNSMAETAKKVMLLTNQVPNLQLQIDPTAFERYEIHQVPALVVAVDDCFDVIYGNLSLKEGINRIASRGECQYLRGIK